MKRVFACNSVVFVYFYLFLNFKNNIQYKIKRQVSKGFFNRSHVCTRYRALIKNLIH